MKRGFTIIELIVAIVITGILATIGLQVLTYIYTSYLQTRGVSELEAKTQITLEILGKRLQYRIKPTLTVLRANNYYSLDDATRNDLCNNTSECKLIWYKQDYESQRLINSNGKIQMAWSGFTNMDFNSTKTTGATTKEMQFSSPGSNEKNFTDNESAVVFKGTSSSLKDFYGSDATSNSPSVFKSSKNAKNIIFSKSKDGEIEVSDQYYISDTANELYLNHCEPDRGCNLNLTYSYKPWLNTTTHSALLAENVSSFKFTQLGSDGIILKLCMIDPNQKITDSNRNLEVCKTQAVQ